ATRARSCRRRARRHRAPLKTRGHALGAADEPQRPPRRSGSGPAFPLAPLPHFTGVVRAPARGPRGGVPHPPNGPANRATLPPTAIAPEVGHIVNKRRESQFARKT